MIIVGIDNGLSGGVAILDGPDVGLHVMPTIKVKTGEKGKTQIDTAEIRRLLRGLSLDDTVVYIERAAPRPDTTNGKAGMFSFGFSSGQILGIVIGLGLRHHLVSPKVWMKEMHAGGAGGDTKARSREAAIRSFPEVDFRATLRCKKPHDGILEAALIAAYGRRLERA